MLTHVAEGRLTLERLVDLTSHGPNRIFGLADKGRIAEGFDADLTIVDLKARRTIRHADMASRVGWTPFDGFEAKGWPVATIVRGITVMRDAGEIRRGGLAPLVLPPGEAVVWDGRFEIATDRPDLTVKPLSGLATKLPPAQQAGLRAVPAAARPTLPVLVRQDGAVSCPILAETPTVRVRALALTRFRAATGGVDSEPAP